MTHARKPDRATVERIIREEAAKACIPASDVIHAKRKPAAVEARRRAIWRIVHETGCSANGLGNLWGLDRGTVCDALNDVASRPKAPPPEPPRRGVYDGRTIERLTWAHGPERAAQIVAGEDARTNLDVARWNRLCRRDP